MSFRIPLDGTRFLQVFISTVIIDLPVFNTATRLTNIPLSFCNLEFLRCKSKVSKASLTVPLMSSSLSLATSVLPTSSVHNSIIRSINLNYLFQLPPSDLSMSVLPLSIPPVLQLATAKTSYHHQQIPAIFDSLPPTRSFHHSPFPILCQRVIFELPSWS